MTHRPSAVALAMLAFGAAAAWTPERRRPPAPHGRCAQPRRHWQQPDTSRLGRAGNPYLAGRPGRSMRMVRSAPVAGPNARYVSNRIFNDEGQNIFSERGVSQWGWVWGQFMDHDFGLRDETPGDGPPIAFDKKDPLEDFRNDFGAIDFSRTPARRGPACAAPPART